MRLLIVLALAIACASAQNYPPLTDSVLQMLSEGQTYMNAEPPDTKILLREYDFIVVPEWKVLLIEAGQEENIVMDIPLAANMLHTSRGYLHPARNRRNLHVRKYSQVTRVIIDPKTKTAIGVEFERARKRYQVLARKEVILSAGAIGSPHLLLLSGVGPKKHLQEKGVKVVKNLPVGYNLQDHVALGGLTVLINQPVSIKTDRILSNATALNMFLTQHRGPITIPGGCEALAFIDTKNDDPRNTDGYPDLELLLVAGAVSSEPTLKLNFGIKNSVYDSVYRDTEALDGFMVLPMIMRPKSTGFDLDVAVAGVRKVQELIKTPAMRQLGAQLLQTPLPGCTSMPFDSDDYWKCHARHLPFTIYHLSGSCKMGPASDRTAVVDPRLRVHGVRNLRVVDASIMPKVTASHTNAPVIMIAEKAADMIKQDHGKRTDF
ncbi:unnamed protein product [Bemisia tabaci]|uniref:Glucose-methanol-choline oxidoreductase N-terminal domain-containing protein n=1 Tax=Bemisia tabaci TaxID=7038 RepID=A0A9P0F6D0_BEMTA|nr:unnamed protein product [Bemisia tabaci]